MTTARYAARQGDQTVALLGRKANNYRRAADQLDNIGLPGADLRRRIAAIIQTVIARHRRHTITGVEPHCLYCGPDHAWPCPPLTDLTNALD